MEEVLRRKMATLPEVEARFGWTATQDRAGRDGVRVTVERGRRTDARCSRPTTSVGCDGGHSLVREQIGIARGGTDFDQLMVLIVFRSRELHEGLGKRFPPSARPTG